MAAIRIALIGQQAFGKAVLEALLERGEEVIAVYCAPDREGRRADPLKEAALGRGIELSQPASYKEPAVWDEFRAMNPDLGVMAFVTLFVPEDFLYIPAKGTIQYHPSLLPRHRGPSSINWPIIQGATKTGLSIFWPDNGLDTGPILMQKEVDILENDTLGTVLFRQAVPARRRGDDRERRPGARRQGAQDPCRTTASPPTRAGAARPIVEIDWAKPAEAVHNLIRGADPAPGAWTSIGGTAVQLFESRRADGSGGAPGEIVAVGEGRLVIAAGDGHISVGRARPEGGGKVAADAFAGEAGISAGTRAGG